MSAEGRYIKRVNKERESDNMQADEYLLDASAVVVSKRRGATLGSQCHIKLFCFET